MTQVDKWRILTILVFIAAFVVEFTDVIVGKGMYLMIFACYCALQTISSQLGEKK